MKTFSLIFLATTLCSAAAAASLNTKRTVAQIQSDLTTISAQAAALNTTTSGISATGPTAAQALAVHSGVSTLAASLNSVVETIKATGGTTLSEADGQAIVNQFHAVANGITIIIIIIRRPTLAGHMDEATVSATQQDIVDLKTSVSAFESALTAISPPDIAPQIATIKASLDAEFSKALAGF